VSNISLLTKACMLRRINDWLKIDWDRLFRTEAAKEKKKRKD